MAIVEAYLKLCQARAGAILLGAAFLTLLLAVLTYPRLSFSADRQTLFRASEQEKAEKAEFERRFGGWTDLIAVLDGGTAAEREKEALRLAEKMSASALFEDVRASLEMPGLERQALYFLDSQELARIDDSLARHHGAISRLAREGWYGFLESGPPARKSTTKDEQQQRFSDAWQRSVESRGSQDPGELFPHLKVPSRVFYTDGEQRHLVFFRSTQPLAAMEALREMSHGSSYSGRVVMMGQPLLRAQEEKETVRDAVLSAFLSVLLVQLLLIHGFRETTRPRLAFLSLLFGLLWSASWAALAVGTLNIITINFISITVGLGIDFSVHYLARYAEERVETDAYTAMLVTWRTTGLEILVGAVATSMAFFALLFTDFQAVKELGIITGMAILLCLVSVVVLLPPLIFWHEERKGFRPLNLATVPWLRQAEGWLRTYPRQALAAASLLVLVLSALGTRVRFDYNLLNLQSNDFESIVYEKESGFCTLAAYVVADDPEQAMQLKERLEKLSSVRRVATVAQFFPREPEAKEALVESIVARAKGIPLPSFDPEARPDWSRMRQLAKGWQDNPDKPDWVKALADAGPGPIEQIWRQMQGHLQRELSRMLEDLRSQQTRLEIKEWKSHFPTLLRYSNVDGKTLLRVQGKHSLWERTALVEFTDQVRSATDRGVGPPFLIRNYLEQMRKSYFDAVQYAIVAIVLLLFLYFRSVLRTFIALVPKVVGTAGMLGAMGICGVNFNPANCMALPLTLGIGLVFGIHAVHRCLEHPDELLIEGSTGKSISLAAWTDIVSFGTMLVASNPAIFSIGFVMAIGVAANLIATYVLVPPLVVVFRERLRR